MGIAQDVVRTSSGNVRSNHVFVEGHINQCCRDVLPRGETQAFDVAAYINSQSRPVKKNLEADFPARKNKPVDAAFAPYTPGFSSEQHKYGPWQPILAAREKGVYPPK